MKKIIMLGLLFVSFGVKGQKIEVAAGKSFFNNGNVWANSYTFKYTHKVGNVLGLGLWYNHAQSELNTSQLNPSISVLNKSLSTSRFGIGPEINLLKDKLHFNTSIFYENYTSHSIGILTCLNETTTIRQESCSLQQTFDTKNRGLGYLLGVDYQFKVKNFSIGPQFTASHASRYIELNLGIKGSVKIND